MMTRFAKLRTLLSDDCGAVYGVECLLLTVVFALGMLAGLAYFRDGIVQEFGDTAVALETLDQGYEYSRNGVVHTHNDDGTALSDPLGAPPAGITLTGTPPGE